MAHFAELDENNMVIRVLVGDNNATNEGYDWIVNNLGGRWIQTSYNGNFRKNFAGAGFTYDEERDAFIPPKPFDSWILNEDSCLWESPVSYPQDEFIYAWDESVVNWVQVQGE